MQLSDNIRGALLMMGAMCAYTVNDAFMKLVTMDIPLFQAILFRGMGAVLGLTVMCHILGQLRFDLTGREWRLILLRSFCEVGATYFFLTALLHMPIANISAILQALPLTVTLAAALFLGEAVGWRRLAAIAVGFVGVVLIIQPGGAGFNAFSIYALISVGCVTARDLVVRRMPRSVPSVFVALVAAVGVTCLGAVGSLTVEFVPWTGMAVAQLATATVFLMGGYICSVAAMRWGEIGFVAPFRYTALVVALGLGVWMFEDWPDGLTLLGAAIVVATGLFTLYREQHLRRAKRRQEACE